jgi:hypothetical protein
VIGLKVPSPGGSNDIEVTELAQEAGRIVIHLQAKIPCFTMVWMAFFKRILLLFDARSAV